MKKESQKKSQETLAFKVDPEIKVVEVIDYLQDNPYLHRKQWHEPDSITETVGSIAHQIDKLRNQVAEGFRALLDLTANKAQEINALVMEYKIKTKTAKDVSDGSHSFDELYEYRKLYNAAFFNMLALEWHDAQLLGDPREMAKAKVMFKVHKSRRHSNGKFPFGSNEWFIVAAVLPTGLVTNYYKMEDWSLFNIPEFPISVTPYDGHTPEEAAERIKNYLLMNWPSPKSSYTITVEELSGANNLQSNE